MLKKRILAAMLCCGVILMAGCSNKKNDENKVSKPTVAVAEAEKGIIKKTKQFEGVLSAKNEVIIGVSTPGKVLTSNVEVGKRVSKGELLFTMDSRDVAVQRKTGEAQYNAARRAEEFARDSMNQMESQKNQLTQSRDQLVGQLSSVENTLNAGVQLGFVSQQEASTLAGMIRNKSFSSAASLLESIINNIDTTKPGASDFATGLRGYSAALESVNGLNTAIGQIEGNMASAKGQVISAQGQREVASASLQVIDAQIRNFRVYAPIDGVIGINNIHVGAYPGVGTSPSDQIPLTIMDISQVEMTINVVDADLMLIKEGDVVDVNLDAMPEKPVQGTIKTISPTIDIQTRTYPVTIVIENSEDKLKPGFFAKTDLIFDKAEDAIIVPLSAVVQPESGAEPYVFVYKDGKAVKTKVELGIEDKNSYVQIKSGVDKGDMVITSNLSSLQDGVQVNIATTSATKTDLDGGKE